MIREGDDMTGNTGAPRRPWVRVAAVLAPLLASAILSAFRDDITAVTSALVLVVLVVAAAATGDRPAGLLAALSAGAGFDLFLTEPYLRFVITDAEDVEATVLLVVISLAVTEVALWGYRQQQRAARRAGYLDGMLDAARAAIEGDLPTRAVHDVVARHITDVLGAEDCRWVAGPVTDVRIAILDHNGVLTRNGHEVDVDRSGLPVDEYVAVPVHRGPDVVGHFLVTAVSHPHYPTHEQLRVAVLLARQVAPLDA